MIFEDIKEEIKTLMNNILYYYNLKSYEIHFEISEPPIKEYGDLSCNIAFILSKKLKKAPFEIANDIINKIHNENIYPNKKDSLVETVSVEKPGFINFKINIQKFLKVFFSKVDDISKISEKPPNDDLILIEHTSVNPNKALHVGHVRNAIIGDCLYRLLSITNHNVKVLNYIDDSGLQIADIIVAFKYANISPELKENSKHQKFDHYCGQYVYIKINELYATRPDLEIKRKLVLKELEKPDSEISEFTRNIVTKILLDQLETCWNLKCHYDLLNFESQIIQSNLWKDVFSLLKQKDVIKFETTEKNANCWVFSSEKEGDKILVRSDSTVTYFAKDIPYALWKLGHVKNPFQFKIFSKQWDNTLLYQTKIESNIKDVPNTLLNFDKIDKVITIIDFRQKRLQSLLLEILNKINLNENKYVYLGYEPVALSNKTLEMIGFKPNNKKSTQMSGRKGIFIEADIALEVLVKKSYEEVKKRNPNFTEEESYHIAKEIAVSAIRYYFIKQDMEKMITFDMIESLSLDGDTGPYIQYSYARAMRIKEKIENTTTDYHINNSNAMNIEFELSDNEIELIKHLCKFSITLTESINNYEPKIIARYLFKLSLMFNNFYENSPIIKEEGQKKNIRIKILESTLSLMGKCMKIIGITLLSKM
ncbi:MAG TPA: arginine--tRNA ligase [Verrucomicrobiae bacterium]|nr:arginine--tRNA ligase [Verrucomicrobiae bacterium]